MREDFFNIQSEAEFEASALEIFRFQAKNNEVYGKYVKLLGVDAKAVRAIEEIPFLPIELFKTEAILSSPTEIMVRRVTPPVILSGAKGNPPGHLLAHNSIADTSDNFHVFTSSGTTGSEPSRHYVTDIALYEKSFKKCFDLFYGDIKEYCVLALLPSYLERKGSSLVYMMDKLIADSSHADSGFYLYEHEKLHKTLIRLREARQKTWLIGVSYSLLDFTLAAEDLAASTADGFDSPKKGANSPTIGFSELIVVETGGMKGKREEMLREELHTELKKVFGVNEIHSEYGMTELLSQAYSKGHGLFCTPPWMKIIIRQVSDPMTICADGDTGLISVIDLANLNSCAFITTSDLGKKHRDGTFEVLGRTDFSDIRGCNLMIE